MININFCRNGRKDCTEAHCEVTLDIPVERSRLIFKFNCNTQYASELLVRHCREELEKAIRTAHENGYNQGWKDAKAKTKKKTWFSDSFEERNEQVAWED